MPKNRIVTYGLLSLTVLAIAGVAIWKIWPEILERLEARPYPPQLSEVAGPLESGDTYILQWTPATAGPQPEFYYLERSTSSSFATTPRYYVAHQAGKTPSRLFIAPAVSGLATLYHRVLTGYKSKHYAAAEVLSDPSNVVSLSVKQVPDPSLLPIKGPLYSGQDYQVSWTSVSNANAYTLEEQSPSAGNSYKLSTTSKTFTATPLGSGGGSFCYRVRAAKTAGATWVAITGWSNQQCVKVNDVPPPPDLTATPQLVESGKTYKISWKQPPTGPQPASSYEYRLRRTAGATVTELAWQTATSASYQAPTVTSQQAIQYEVKANFGKKPMTVYSAPVTVTIKPPPPPPPPSITKVEPDVAPHGATVKIPGQNLAKAKVDLYIAGSGKSVAVTPKSQTDKEITFVVPTGASLKTTQVRASAAGTTAQASFTVGRKPGKFTERQKNVTIVPPTQTCGKFSSQLKIAKKGLPYYTGGFREGSKVLVAFPEPGFKAFKHVTAEVGGLGFSKACKVGMQVASWMAGSAPVFINFYALDLGNDSAYSPGDKIKGPHSIEPSVYYIKGFKLLFSPDESIAAVINRNKVFSDQYGIAIWTLDLLTGNKLPQGPYFYDGKKGTSFSLSIDSKNRFSIERGGVKSAPVTIPKP